MIFHASIPADNPEHVARVIAELWQGEAVPFPPIPGTWMAFAFDERGSEIEVSPRSLAYVPGETDLAYRDQPETPRHCSSHLLIASRLTAEEILAIGEREGWTARRCRRGGPDEMGFDLIEFWVENAYMLEVATAEWQSQYLNFMTGQPARRMFGISRAA